nr:hypothetical protein [Massilia glaciei]
MKLERGKENAHAYRLVVEWDTLEDHEIHFRGSEDFQAWRALVGGLFAEPPRVRIPVTLSTDSKRGQSRQLRCDSRPGRRRRQVQDPP